MSKKYELTNETKLVNGHTLYRIRALKDFGNVKAGDLGGFVESEFNLSHNGTCWVYDNAKVYGNAEVYCYAEVYDYARVYDDAKVYHYAKAYGKAWISDLAQVYGNAKVNGNTKVYDTADVHGDVAISEGIVNGDADVC